MIVVVVVVVALVVVGFVLVALVFNKAVDSTRVTVTGINWTIEYQGSSSGYFGPTSLSSCTACPMTMFVGAEFSDTITLESSATQLNHSIGSVTVGAPFLLLSIEPTLPQSVPPGGSVSLNLLLEAPPTGGSYGVTGTIGTS